MATLTMHNIQIKILKEKLEVGYGYYLKIHLPTMTEVCILF